MKDQVIQFNCFSVTLKVQTSSVVEFKGPNVILVNEQNAKDVIMSILLYFAY